MALTTLFSGASSVGAQASINLGNAYNQFTTQISLNSGTLSNIVMDLEGSLDNVTFFKIQSMKNITTAHTSPPLADKYFQYVRGNITTLTGSSPNISAYIVPIGGV